MGILHAFGPDHLTAIADFSIGKDKKKTLLITFLFAIGHGFSLFVFAKILQNMEISDNILAYGDIISAVVIIGMGLYILFMVYSNRNSSTENTPHNRERGIFQYMGLGKRSISPPLFGGRTFHHFTMGAFGWGIWVGNFRWKMVGINPLGRPIPVGGRRVKFWGIGLGT